MGLFHDALSAQHCCSRPAFRDCACSHSGIVCANTTNQLADAETCKSLKTQLHSDRLREFAILGLLTVAEERGDAEEVWRFKRKLNSAGWYENIKSDAFYRTCPEAPIQ
jgi:hypothetical protein